VDQRAGGRVAAGEQRGELARQLEPGVVLGRARRLVQHPVQVQLVLDLARGGSVQVPPLATT
jgi:hypothetical protein